MHLTPHSALDKLTRMVQVIGCDPDLRRWFIALGWKSLVERRNEIYAASERMRGERKDADLVSCVGLLADPRVFDAASAALQEYDRNGG